MFNVNYLYLALSKHKTPLLPSPLYGNSLYRFANPNMHILFLNMASYLTILCSKYISCVTICGNPANSNCNSPQYMSK